MNFPAIYLASNSPRRQELLDQIGVSFSMLSVNIDESILQDEAPIDYVKRVAIAKAQAGWKHEANNTRRPVLGADTSVIVDDRVLGKPVDSHDARRMLEQLSGRTHQVITAVAFAVEDEVLCKLSVSKVSFAVLSEKEIDWYLQTKEGVDKAGGYAVQGLAALFIDRIDGSYSGIMGLPLRETGLLLSELSEFT